MLFQDLLLPEDLHSVDDGGHEDEAGADDGGYRGAHGDRRDGEAEKFKVEFRAYRAFFREI